MRRARRRARARAARRGGWAGLAGGAGLLAASLLPAILARGQEERGFLRYTLTGERFADELGRSLAALGDVDGDGAPDFAAGVPEERFEPGATGKVIIVSGKTGSVIRSWRSEEGLNYGDSLANAGDVDGDRVSDVLASGFSYVELRSGSSGALLRVLRDRTYAVGLSLASLGDVDQDGTPDFAVGNWRPQDSAHARARVHSGRTGEVLWTREAERRRDEYAAALAALGDVNGDGIGDLAVGALGSSLADDHRGIVYVLRGQDGAEVYRIVEEEPRAAFGGSLVALGDVDRDGVRDLAVSASGYPVHGLWGAGRVSLHSGRTGALLWSQTGQDFDHWVFGSGFRGDAFGASLGAAGDADGDGLEDLLVWSYRPGAAGDDFGRASLLSGRSGLVLASYEAEANHTEFGRTLSGLGDLDGDGRSEFIIAAPQYPELGTAPRQPDGHRFFAAGRLYVVSYRPEGRAFIRADADLDGRVSLSDGVFTLKHLFEGGPAPCQEAMDVDRDRRLGLTDALVLLVHLFQSGAAPQPPYPGCGVFESFKGRLPCERSSCR